MSRSPTLRQILRGLSLVAVVAWARPAAAQTEAYRILLTNDDGIESPGIQALADELRGIADVLVVAPCGQRSGSSMAVDLRQAVRLRPIQRDGRLLGQCVDATPAGAVLLGLTALAPPGGFDLVVSGINAGANVGDLAHMSGTVGGAMMGAFHGVPAVAASLGGRIEGFEYAAAFVRVFVEELRRRPPLPGIVLSVNIPGSSEEAIRGVTAAAMGGSYLALGYEETDDPGDGRTFRSAIGRATEFPAGSDTDAFMQGFITVTPIAFDWTANGLIEEIGRWSLTHRVGRP